MRLALTISSMRAGGAERILSVLANHWDAQGHDVRIFTFSPVNEASFFKLHGRVGLTNLNREGDSLGVCAKISGNWQRLKGLRKSIRAWAPDIVISFGDTTNVLTILSMLGTGIPVIASERTYPGRHRIGRMWEMLRMATYPLADAVTVQTEAAKACLSGVDESSLYVIPNPVTIEDNPEGKCPVPFDRFALCVGRQTWEKGFDMAIAAFAGVSARYPKWGLVLVGDGSERAALEKQAAEAGVADKVFFPGIVVSPKGYYEAADLFVLPSRYEGFPNALCEAMAFGTPIVAYDCLAGPGEIVRHEKDGLLVTPESVSDLAKALERLMEDGDLRVRFGKNAREIAKRYDKDAVLGGWQRLIEDVISKKGTGSRG